MTRKFIPLMVLMSLIFTTLSCQTTSLFSKPATVLPASTVVVSTVESSDNSVVPLSSAAQVQPVAADLLPALYQRVSPGVVSIQVLTDDGGGQGSGFVYNKEGYIVTNDHVVNGAKEIYINFSSGLKVHGKIVAEDPDSDLGVIKVEVPSSQLSPVSLGDSDQVKVGQSVVAIGNPYGLSGTMTEGIVSAKGRTLESLRLSSGGTPYSAGDIIQTDASINPGNSGGPLLNLSGEVIGINRAIRTSGTLSTGDPINTGIGFAISINIVKKVVPVLIKEGHYDYPFLGVKAREELTLLEVEALKLPQTTGAYVVEVTQNGPAAQVGIKAGSKKTEISGLLGGGDLIVAADGHPVFVFGDLLTYLMTHKTPGDKLILTILRDGNKQDVEVTLDKRQ